MDIATETWSLLLITLLSVQCVIANVSGLEACGERRTVSWPWLTSIYTKNYLGMKFLCAGTLISSTAVITTAHCVYEKYQDLGYYELHSKDIYVYLGESWQLVIPKEKNAHKVSSVIIPKVYQSGYRKRHGDLALLILSAPVKLSPEVQPICLPQAGGDTLQGKSGTIASWVRSKEDPDYLRPTSKHSQIYPPTNCGPANQYLLKTQKFICASFPPDAGPCNARSNGDSLYVETWFPDGTKRYTVEGILSRLLSKYDIGLCKKEQNFVFTKISSHLQYLENHMSRYQDGKKKNDKITLATCDIEINKQTDKLDFEIEEMSNNIANLSSQIESLKITVTNKNNQMSQLKNDLKDKRMECQQWQEKHKNSTKKCSKEKDHLKSKNTMSIKEVSRLKDEINIKIKEINNCVMDYNNTMQMLEKTNDSFMMKINKAVKEISDLKVKDQLNEGIINEYKVVIASQTEQITMLKSEASEMNETLDMITLNHSNMTSENIELQDTITTQIAEISKLQSNISDTNIAMDQCSTELEDLRQKNKNLKLESANKTKTITELNKDLLVFHQAVQKILDKYKIAKNLYNTKMYDKALPLFKEVVHLREQILGQEHVDTLQVIKETASTLNALGKFDEALPLLQDLLEKQTRVLGEDSVDTWETMSFTAFTLFMLGKFPEAYTLYQKVLEKRRVGLGVDHAGTLEDMQGIGHTLFQMQRYKEAMSYFDDVTSKFEQKYGTDNLKTINAMNVKAIILQKLDKIEEALELANIVLEKRIRIQGKNHPDTIIAKNNVEKINRSLLSKTF